MNANYSDMRGNAHSPPKIRKLTNPIPYLTVFTLKTLHQAIASSVGHHLDMRTPVSSWWLFNWFHNFRDLAAVPCSPQAPIEDYQLEEHCFRLASQAFSLLPDINSKEADTLTLPSIALEMKLSSKANQAFNKFSLPHLLSL